MYKCDTCSYTTNKKSNLNNHRRRKTPCTTRSATNNNTQSSSESSITNKDEETSSNKEPVAPPNDDVVCQPCDDVIVTKSDRFKCSKCDKILSTKQSLDNHEGKCDGLHPLQCNVCLKMFASRYGKYEHKKNVKCTPVNKNGVTNIHNDYSTNNIHNDNSVTINFNFDTYNHDHVKIDKLKTECRALKSSLDCAVKYIQHIFFDPKCPERRLVALNNLKPDYKFIDVFRNEKWEKETQHSVISTLLQKSLKLMTSILRDEDPNHVVVFDPESEQTDNIKKYESNMTLDNNNYRRRAGHKMKKEIYNKTKDTKETNEVVDDDECILQKDGHGEHVSQIE